MAPKITRVAIRDYRSIGFCDVEMHPLTLLVGPNGSGKSNFLDALRFLVHSMLSPLEQVVEERGGIRSILRRIPNGLAAENFSVRLSLEFEGFSATYSLTVGADSDGASVIEEECCTVGPDEFKSIRGELVRITTYSSPAFTGDRPALAALGGLAPFAPVFHFIAGLTFYEPDLKLMRRPASVGPGKVLFADGSNAADVLARIERTEPQVATRIKGYVRSLNPEFRNVTSNESGNFRWLEFESTIDPAKWIMSSADVSDGTLRAIGILLAIFQYSETARQISLVGLEEPESNLHPAAAGILLDALLEASEHVQIIASTHSADLLDRKELPVSSLLAVALRDGETVIGPINEIGKSIVRDRLYTAGDLLRNNELAPVSSSDL